MHIPSFPPSLCCTQIVTLSCIAAPLPPPTYTYRSDDLRLMPTYPILLPCTLTLLSYLAYLPGLLTLRLPYFTFLLAPTNLTLLSCILYLPDLLTLHSYLTLNYPLHLPYLLPCTLTLPFTMHTYLTLLPCRLHYPLTLHTFYPVQCIVHTHPSLLPCTLTHPLTFQAYPCLLPLTNQFFHLVLCRLFI
jgi:hypothetical protein